jgi:hypothetical protein
MSFWPSTMPPRRWPRHARARGRLVGIDQNKDRSRGVLGLPFRSARRKPQGGAVWNRSMTSGYEMWKAAKGSPPRSALIFQSNDAVGLVERRR